jgi:hypothetical protein
MKKKQKRYKRSVKPLYILLGLVIIIIIAGIAWKHGGNTQSDAQDPSSPTQLYIDSAKKFTFKYPTGWVLQNANSQPVEGPPGPQPDWTKVSRPINVVPAKAPAGNTITITPGCEVAAADGSTISVVQDLKNHKDQFHTQTASTNNGNDVFYDKLAFKGDAESYTDHTYVVSKGSNCLKLNFRQNYQNTTLNQSFDDSQDLPGFMTLVNSVHF